MGKKITYEIQGKVECVETKLVKWHSMISLNHGWSNEGKIICIGMC